MKKPSFGGSFRAKTRAASKSDGPVSEQAKWVGGQALVTRLMRWGIFAAIACGVVALLLVVSGAVSSGPPPAKQRPVSTTDSGAEAAAGDFAEQFVLTWLQAKRGDEKLLAPFVATDAVRLGREQTFIASDARTASIEPASTDASTSAGAGAATVTGAASSTTAGAPGGGPAQQKTYAVTVSVTVRAVQDAATAATRRYFHVPVVITDGSARAAAMPAPVAPPASGPDIGLGYRFRVAPQQPPALAVQQFLAALVAGSGEISRYVSPGTEIRPIEPAPYQSVQLFDVAADHDFSVSAKSAPRDGNAVRVLATAELVVDEGAQASVTGQYALTLTARGGRWEVSGMDPAPLLPPGRSDQGITAGSGSASSTPTTTSAVPSTPPASSAPSAN